MKVTCSLAIIYLLTIMACAPPQQDETQSENTSTATLEGQAILDVLNAETLAFCNRDYDRWQDCWIQEPLITKVYLNPLDSTSSVTTGWLDISAFAKTYFAEHLENQVPPPPLEAANIRLYTDGAWVSFEQIDPQRGRKVETRLMEKLAGQWRIAGMQTIIYGD